jgi:hypothetical protein
LENDMKLKTSPLLLALLLLLISPAFAPKADAQPPHPAYIHALTDLRLARTYLDRLTPSERLDDAQVQAVHELEQAISEIKAASIDDGKDIGYHAPIDARIQPRDRFAKAHEALDAAMHDVQQPESDPRTQALQRSIINHISHAITTVRAIQAHVG